LMCIKVVAGQTWDAFLRQCVAFFLHIICARMYCVAAEQWVVCDTADAVHLPAVWGDAQSAT